MSFMTGQPDLSKTIFNENDLRLAREFLQPFILLNDPPWLNKPQGILGEYWQRNDTQAACYLIDLAMMIDILDHKVATKSIPRLYDKVRKLLRPPNNRHSINQYLETLNELQVAFALIDSLEANITLAFLTEDDFIDPKMTRAPDFGLKISEGIVLIDATIFHGGILDTWKQTVNKISNTLRDYLLKQDIALCVSIALPLKIDISSEELVNLALNAFSSSSTGSLPIGSKGLLEWEPFPIGVIQDNSHVPQNIPSSVGAAFGTPGVIIDKAYASQTNIKLSSEEDILQARELVLRGLRSKLDEKKTQFPPKRENEPCFVAMRLEHHQIGEGDITAMLNQRIWPNKDYNWLTGLVLFTPRPEYTPENHIARLVWHFNPRSSRPATVFLKDMLCKPS